MARGTARWLWVVAFLAGVGLAGATPASAEEPVPPLPPREERPAPMQMGDVVDPVKVDHAPAKQAFEWWSRTTGIPLVINWAQLEKEGVDAQTPIDLDLRGVPAGQLLGLIMQQASDQPLIYEITPWYVSITTKAEANKHLVMRIYEVGDLVFDPSSVGAPPRFDLATALSSGSGSGGGGGAGGSGRAAGGGGSSTGLFQSGTASQEKKGRTEEERSGDITKLIRETIEPEIWSENGGPASIRYYQGRLIVHAPQYVQAQIGTPAPSRGPLTANPDYKPTPPREGSNGVAGVDTLRPPTVAGRADK